MPLDESRTTSDSAADHVSDHNLLHARYNDDDGWESWVAVSGGVGFSNSWVNYSTGGSSDAAYRKHTDGRVQLRGVIKSGTSTAAAFTLPTGYRPIGTVFFGAISNGAAYKFRVVSDGTVVPTGHTGSFSVLGFFDSTGGS